MTLRLRLVLSLVVLIAAALAIFALVTSSEFSRKADAQLDRQLRGTFGAVKRDLDLTSSSRQAEPSVIGGVPFLRGSSPEPGGFGGGPHDRPVQAPPGTFGAKLRADGTAIRYLPLSGSVVPALPNPLPSVPATGRLLNLRSTDGKASFRALLMPGANGTVYVEAAPTTSIRSLTGSVIAIDTVGAAILLLAVSAGAWLLLRRGLRPLEQMASTAHSITAGDLSQRVTESGPSEVGELGRAFNSMLGDIEAAFLEREATELRLRQFLADASHELRTPLTSIQGFAELFRVSGENARVDLPTILRRIESESARMKVLVDDLLLLARLDQTRAAQRAPVDLAVLAADACSDAVAMAPDRPVTLDAPEPVIVAGDQDHLRQAIANLVANSLGHTPAGTPIEVSARLDDGSAMVAVRDHGPGLDDEARQHVFDRFWQADKARVGTGAGLGLAIVASIASEHGGQALADNAPGGGAIFTVRLPLNGAGSGLPAAMERAPRLG